MSHQVTLLLLEQFHITCFVFKDAKDLGQPHHEEMPYNYILAQLQRRS